MPISITSLPREYRRVSSPSDAVRAVREHRFSYLPAGMWARPYAPSYDFPAFAVPTLEHMAATDLEFLCGEIDVAAAVRTAIRRALVSRLEPGTPWHRFLLASPEERPDLLREVADYEDNEDRLNLRTLSELIPDLDVNSPCGCLLGVDERLSLRLGVTCGEAIYACPNCQNIGLNAGYCDPCYDIHWECTGCNEDFFGDTHLTTHPALRGENVCVSCEGDVISARAAEEEEDEELDECDCTACVARNRRAQPLQLRSYSTKAEQALPSFRGADNEKHSRDSTVYMGFELEIDIPGGQEALDALEEVVHVKHNRRAGLFARDGSLSDYTGAELKSIPATYRWHTEKKVWTDFFKAAKETGCEISNPNGMGLHIHVSREPLSKLTQAKMMMLVNSDAMRPIVENVSGRRANSWADFVRPFRTLPDASYGLSSPARGKYEVMNVTHRHTIEFRCFAATLEYDRWLACMQLVKAIVTFCSANASAREIDATAFVKWVAARSGQYKELMTVMHPDKDARAKMIRAARNSSRKVAK